MLRIAGWAMAVLALLAGCRLDTGRLTPPGPAVYPEGVPGGTVDMASTTEVELVERLQKHRLEYGQTLEMLVDYYSRTGNKKQLEQARSELDAFKTMPQYSYVGELVPGPELRATTIIPEADAIYLEAQRLHREANALVFLKDRIYQRRALDAYKRLISRFPASDKIDDAAFQIATIYEDLRDYQAAMTYYQRAYQWDPQTIHPARFKVAYILDQYLRRKADAIDLYKAALETEAVRHVQWARWAENRIAELSKEQ